MKENKSKIIFIIIMVIELIVIGVGVFFAIKLANNTGTEPTETVTPSTVTTDDTETGNSKYKMHIVFDGMTATEIAEDLKNISKISNGDIAKDFTDRFILGDDVKFIQDQAHTFGEYPEWTFYTSSANIFVSQIDTYNLKETADGKIEVNNGAYIAPYIQINDKDAAEDLFEKIIEAIFSKENVDTDEVSEKKHYVEAYIDKKHYIAVLSYYSDYSLLHIELPVK